MSEPSRVTVEQALDIITDLESPTRLVISRVGPDGWAAGVEFGREAPDSPMAGGAAYGMGTTAAEALIGVIMDGGFKVKEEPDGAQEG